MIELLKHPRFRLLYQALRILLLLAWALFEFTWVSGMTFVFGQPRNIQELATAIFLQGFAAGVVFLLLNQLMVRGCRWFALRLAALIWNRFLPKQPQIVDVPLSVA